MLFSMYASEGRAIASAPTYAGPPSPLARMEDWKMPSVIAFAVGGILGLLFGVGIGNF